LLRGGKLHEATRRGIAGIKPHAKKTIGGVSREILKTKTLNKYVFLKLFHFRVF
jgi:hypothetical protein